jgi:hypothetical protein
LARLLCHLSEADNHLQNNITIFKAHLSFFY